VESNSSATFISPPALGGCRIEPYDFFAEQRNEVISGPANPFSLPETMTKKAVMAGVPFGGGKAVINADPRDPAQKNARLLQAFARALIEINKEKTCYYTGEDAGMNVMDVEEIAKITGGLYVAGRSDTVFKEGFRGSGNPGHITAQGMIRGMKAVCNFLDIGDYFDDKTIAIQGIGNVGEPLIRKLVERYPGVKIIASDKECDHDADDTHKKRYLTALCQMLNKQIEGSGGSVRLVHSSAIYWQRCDIFAPCALRVTLNKDNIPHLRCRAVVAAQNNPLATPQDADLLYERGIEYPPDYITNAGGLINVADELDSTGYSYDRVVYDKVWKIYDRTLHPLKQAAKEKVPPYVVADKMVEEKLEELQNSSV